MKKPTWMLAFFFVCHLPLQNCFSADSADERFCQAILELDVETVKQTLEADTAAARTPFPRTASFREKELGKYPGYYPIEVLMLKIGFPNSTGSRKMASEQRQESVTRGTAILKLLLEHEADPNHICHSKSLLHLAVNSGELPLVKLLVEQGADVDAVTPKGFCGRWNVTPLHTAVDKKFIARYLVQAGADRTIKDSSGKQAWQYANLFEVRYLLYPEEMSRKRFAIMERQRLLLELKAQKPLSSIPLGLDVDVAFSFNAEETTLLREALRAPDPDYANEAVRTLIRMGADPELKTRGESPLEMVQREQLLEEDRINSLEFALQAAQKGMSYLEYVDHIAGMVEFED